MSPYANVHFEKKNNNININCTASLAVDGYANCNLLDGSTSHTDDDPNANWNLTLDPPKVVNRFVIYNR
ncbi:cell death abnormality protein 1, partial [Biomphalaria pfeifferi]